ncbi:MAG: hypothetical protein K6G26_01920 [Lachnospiraceae bacterium]|nr:hypothetical protein [Lachnospiraceae bacterium]
MGKYGKIEKRALVVSITLMFLSISLTIYCYLALNGVVPHIGSEKYIPVIMRIANKLTILDILFHVLIVELHYKKKYHELISRTTVTPSGENEM